jgi:hypothetical protein
VSTLNMRRFRYGVLGALFLAVDVLVMVTMIIVASVVSHNYYIL